MNGIRLPIQVSTIKLQLGKRGWFSHRFIHTQYFYSFKKSKICFKGTLEGGDCKTPFYFNVKSCYSKIPFELNIPIDKEISFSFSKRDRECLSNSIECRFPISGVYYFEITPSEIHEYPNRTIIPLIHNNPSENITSINNEPAKEEYLVIIQDYFSYKVTQLTIWLTVLTGILILQEVFPRFIPSLINLIKSIL